MQVAPFRSSAADNSGPFPFHDADLFAVRISNKTSRAQLNTIQIVGAIVMLSLSLLAFLFRLEMNVHDLLFLSTTLCFILTAVFLPIAVGALILQELPSPSTPSSISTALLGQTSLPIPTNPPFLRRDAIFPKLPPTLSLSYPRIGYTCLFFVKSAFWWACLASSGPLSSLSRTRLVIACAGILLLAAAYIVEVILVGPAPVIDIATTGLSVPLSSLVIRDRVGRANNSQ